MVLVGLFCYLIITGPLLKEVLIGRADPLVLIGRFCEVVLIGRVVPVVLIGRFCEVVLIGRFCEVVLIGRVVPVVLIGRFCKLVLSIRHLMSWEFSHVESITWTDCIRIQPNKRVLRLLLDGLVPAGDEEEEEEEDRRCEDKCLPFRCKQTSR